MKDSAPPRPPAGRPRLVNDLLASVVVFLVALPLCIGIAQACGLPPEAGIVTGVVGGILVGTLAGSPLQVSGPAAGLIVLVIDFLADAHKSHGVDWKPGDPLVPGAAALLGLSILGAGAVQALAGVFRVGQWFRAVSPAVVGGMLAGIGVTIIAKQFHVMVDDTPPKEILEGIRTIPDAVRKGFDPAGSTINHREAALIGVLTITVLAGWKLLKPKVLKFIPSAVVAVALGVLLNEFGRPVLEAVGYDVGPAVDTHGGLGVARVKVSANLLDGLTPVWGHWPAWDGHLVGLVLKAAFTFAIIASAETLLCATAVDTMHTGPRTRYDRELLAQGLGNMACGLVAALPMTGVIVRSSANVDAGAKTRLSAILHGVWLLLFVSLLPGVLSRIPAAALAAVLVYTGWKLVNPVGVWQLWKQSRGEAVVFVLTAVTIVATDLLTGVVTGVVLAAAKLLWTFSHLEVEREDAADGRRTDLHLIGAASFIRLAKLAEALDAVPAGRDLHIHLDRLRMVDHAVLSLLTTFRKQYEGQGGRLVVDWARLNANFNTSKLAGTATASPPVPSVEANGEVPGQKPPIPGDPA